MKIKYFLLILTVLSMNVFAAEEKKEKADDGKRYYSEEEFHKELVKEVELRLQKIKSGKIVDFSKELLEKEHQLKVKELELKKKEEEFENSKKDFQAQIKEFHGKQQNFLACIDEIDTKEEKRIQHMVDVVSGMKPDSAAQVLSVQDSKISVKILGLLDPAKVSKIFNKMDKEISARLQKQFMTMKK